MKKLLLFLLLLIMPLSVSAKNVIHSIDIDVYLNEDGSANITEIWDVDGSDGTEWYKVINNLGNMELSDFTVLMDGNELRYKEWKVSESLKEKKGYYGINYTSSGLELCFGKYDYNRHTFTLNYRLSNFILTTDDSQVIYYNFIDKLSNVDFKKQNVRIYNYDVFPDTIQTWAFGYEGYIATDTNMIHLYNKVDKDMNDSYVVLLAKFPLGTFNIENRINGYTDFDTIYEMANKGAYSSGGNDVLAIVIVAFVWSIIVIFVIIMVIIIMITLYENGYGYYGNKSVNIKNVNMYREIPFDKDIYYGNVLLKLNRSTFYNEGNILGAVILKWVRDDKIGFRSEVKGVFDKKTSIIDLTKNPYFDNEFEEKLFNMMYHASIDGYLEASEFEKWSRKNYTRFLSLFEDDIRKHISDLEAKGMIRKRNNKKECKYGNILSEQIYEDSIKLYGLKKYLDEFSNMDTKEVMEVKLWDEYLMFAYLFGIADKVSKQLKNMYPDVIRQMSNSNIDYETINFISYVSVSSVKSANSARSAASSSSGGGGGSFGGGGGGSR